MLSFTLALLLGAPFALAADPAPSGAALDALVKDYETSSQNFTNSMQIVQLYVPNCGQMGGLFASKMGEAVPAQQAQRKRILEALKQAQSDIDAQAKKIGDSVTGQAGAGQAAITGATGMIQAGVAKPSKVIDDEVAQMKPYLAQMESNLKMARMVLSTNNQPCQTASKMFENGRSLGLAIPSKLLAIKAALADRRTALLAWASSIQKSLVTNSASVAQK